MTSWAFTLMTKSETLTTAHNKEEEFLMKRLSLPERKHVYKAVNTPSLLDDSP